MLPFLLKTAIASLTYDAGVCAHSLSRVQFFVTLWTVAHQAPLSMEFSRQVYWNGLPFPTPGDLPDPGIEPGSPALQEDSLSSEPPAMLMALESSRELTPHILG